MESLYTDFDIGLENFIMMEWNDYLMKLWSEMKSFMLRNVVNQIRPSYL